MAWFLGIIGFFFMLSTLLAPDWLTHDGSGPLGSFTFEGKPPLKTSMGLYEGCILTPINETHTVSLSVCLLVFVTVCLPVCLPLCLSVCMVSVRTYEGHSPMITTMGLYEVECCIPISINDTHQVSLSIHLSVCLLPAYTMAVS